LLPADQLRRGLPNEGGEAVLFQERAPEAVHLLGDQDVGRLDGILGMEVVVVLDLTGQIQHGFQSGGTRLEVLLAEERRPILQQALEGEPPGGPFGTAHRTVAGHVGSGARQGAEILYLIEHGVAVPLFLLLLLADRLRGVQGFLDAFPQGRGAPPVEVPEQGPELPLGPPGE